MDTIVSTLFVTISSYWLKTLTMSPMKTYQLREGKRLGNIGLLAVVSDASMLLLLPQR